MCTRDGAKESPETSPFRCVCVQAQGCIIPNITPHGHVMSNTSDMHPAHLQDSAPCCWFLETLDPRCQSCCMLTRLTIAASLTVISLHTGCTVSASKRSVTWGKGNKLITHRPLLPPQTHSTAAGCLLSDHCLHECRSAGCQLSLSSKHWAPNTQKFGLHIRSRAHSLLIGWNAHFQTCMNHVCEIWQPSVVSAKHVSAIRCHAYLAVAVQLATL